MRAGIRSGTDWSLLIVLLLWIALTIALIVALASRSQGEQTFDVMTPSGPQANAKRM